MRNDVIEYACHSVSVTLGGGGGQGGRGAGQPYLQLLKPIPILKAEGVIGFNRF